MAEGLFMFLISVNFPQSTDQYNGRKTGFGQVVFPQRDGEKNSNNKYFQF